LDQQGFMLNLEYPLTTPLPAPIAAKMPAWMKKNDPQSAETTRRETAQIQTAREAAALVTALVEQYSGVLYRVSYSILRNATDAEDAVQETFLRVLRHQDSLAEIRDQRVWLVRIAWNISLDRKRRKKTRPEDDDIDDLARVLPADGFTAEEQAIGSQQKNRVLALMEKLPAKERQVLMLSAFEELSTAQIAKIVGTTESSIRSRLFRARKEMAQLMGRDLPTAKGGAQ
jgi:RNA polymerase sigma-70 factor (ECF subfamily)